MKNLLSTLLIGLLLTALTGSTGIRGINLNQKFTKLCGRDFVMKVVTICRETSWKDLLPRLDDHSQASGDADYLKGMMKAQRLLLSNGTRNPDTYNGDQGLHQDLKQNEQLPGDVQGFVPEIEGDHKAQPALEEKLIPPKVSKRKISTSDRCCQNSCTVKQIRRLCFQTK